MITFIVPVYNAERTIGQCIESILAQPLDKEVIVVDNDSSDTTAEIIQQYPVTYLMEAKRGPAAARNRGLREMDREHAKYVVFADSDVVLPEGWLDRAIEILKRDGKIAGVGGPGKATDKSYASRSVDYLLWYPVSKDTRVVSLATMDVCYRYEAIEGIFYAEELIMGEDPEFNFRVIEKGWRLVYSPDLYVHHHHPVTLRQVLKRWYRYGQYYPLPFFRHPRQITFGFLARLAYLPLLIVIFTAGLLVAPLLALCLFLFSLVPFAYLAMSVKLVPGGFKERLTFIFVHSAKQYAKFAGIWKGLLFGRKF